MNYIYTERKFKNNEIVKSLYSKFPNESDKEKKLIFSLSKLKTNAIIKIFTYIDIYNILFACDIVLDSHKDQCTITSLRLDNNSYNNELNVTFLLPSMSYKLFPSLIKAIIDINEKTIFQTRKAILFAFKTKIYSYLSLINEIEEKMKKTNLLSLLNSNFQTFSQNLHSITEKLKFSAIIKEDFPHGNDFINSMLSTTMSFISSIVISIQSIVNVSFTMSTARTLYLIDSDKCQIKRIDNGTSRMNLSLNMLNYLLSYTSDDIDNVIRKNNNTILIYDDDIEAFAITNERIIAKSKFCVTKQKNEIIIGNINSNNNIEGDAILISKGEIKKVTMKNGEIEDSEENVGEEANELNGNISV